MYKVKIKRQLLDHYLKQISNLTRQYGIFKKEISSPKAFHGRYLIQTDDVDIEFSNFYRINTKINNIKTHKERTKYSTTMYFHFSIAFNLYEKQRSLKRINQFKHPDTQPYDKK